jgi:Tfp pilus assembly protein PilW
MCGLDGAFKLLRARLRSESGWTLIELMFAILVSTLVLGTATNLLSSVASLNGTTTREVQAQDKARTAIDTLASQLRNAVGPPGKPPIYYPAAGSSGGSTEVVFYKPSSSASTTNNPRQLVWARYCLDYSTPSNETLWAQTAAYDSTQAGPPSTTACPSVAWATQQPVATNVVNRNATPVTVLFTQNTDSAGAIHDIQVRLLVQGDSSRKPTAITSSVDFRNAKTAPSAVVSCQAQNGHAVCDASKSADPDGEALSYKWKYLCCSPSYAGGDPTWETGQTSYLFDKPLASGSTYAIWVEVTDASGLSTDASQAIAIP